MAKRGQGKGPANHEWGRFTSSVPHQGRDRAARRKALGKCEQCGKPAIDRHHKDDNPLNNEPENIEALCRRCHMIADGRMEKFRAQAKARITNRSE